jgi:hypothetical protein
MAISFGVMRAKQLDLNFSSLLRRAETSRLSRDSQGRGDIGPNIDDHMEGDVTSWLMGAPYDEKDDVGGVSYSP